MRKTIKIEGMHCKNCVARVEKALLPLGKDIKVELSSGIAVMDTEENDDVLKAAVEDLGFIVVDIG